MAGIYLHIPFCRQACTYCDFHFSTVLRNKPGVVAAMAKEVEMRSDFLGAKAPLQTLYFGGGTPSMLDEADWDLLMNAIHRHFTFETGFEFTVEANPDDLTTQKLKQFISMGVNRLSIGIQSFSDVDLKWMNRAHTAQEAVQSVLRAQDAGIHNLSLDLIYGMPGSDDAHWKAQVEQALALHPAHVSVYALTVEEGTALGWQVKKGKAALPPDEELYSQFRLVQQMLAAAGIVQYEISNYCKPGCESRHNSAYWRGEAYLGIGPSAHSFRPHERMWNVANNARYTQQVNEGKLPFAETESLTLRDRVNEKVMTALRTVAGLDLSEIQSLAGVSILHGKEEWVQRWVDEGLVQLSDGHLRLTLKGQFVSDGIIRELFQ